ncbi:MAG: phosphotransferase [Henriciella sp.]|uniref:phosphotransferase n=1 Tax=Henriciella sp. TaxID=1968823 RepID=UPI0032EE08C5
MSLEPDIGLIRSLVRSSFPELSNARVRPVDAGSTDNFLFRIDEDLCLRIAKSDAAAPSLINREPSALKTLQDLPLETPEFMARGFLPDPAPAPWVICTWLDGLDMERAGHPATAEDANRLALFLLDLQGSGRSLASEPAPDNHWRGTDLALRDEPTRLAIRTLSDELDGPRLLDLWDTSLAAPACRPEDRTWIHGDLHPANLLVRDGKVSGVIDWGLSGLGDPACDLMAAYTVFDAETRSAFARATGATESTWLRGRGWALSTAAIALAYYRTGTSRIVARSRHVLGEILAEAT